MPFICNNPGGECCQPVSFLLVGGPHKGAKGTMEHDTPWVVCPESYTSAVYRRTRRRSKDGRTVYQYDVEETKKWNAKG